MADINVRVNSSQDTPRITTQFMNPKAFRVQDATDVAINNPSDGQILTWSANLHKFIVSSVGNVASAFALANNASVTANQAIIIANSAAIIAANAGNVFRTTYIVSGLTVNTATVYTTYGNATVVLSANAGSLTQPGALQLNDTLTSTSIAQAATGNAANALFTYAKSLLPFIQSAYNQANTDNVLAQAAFNSTNATNTFASSGYGVANSALNLATSAFNRANSGGSGGGSQTIITANGITVNTGTNLTVSGNNTILLSANIGNTSQPGIIQLNDTVTSTSILLGSTANSINTVWATANAAFIHSNATNIFAAAAYNLANTTTTGLTSTTNLVTSAYVAVNSAGNLATSAYGRANAAIQNQITLTTTNGIAANGGSFATIVGNNTIALTANNASTTQVGVVQLNDTVSSSSITQSATPNSVLTVWTTAIAAFNKANTAAGGAGSITQTILTSNGITVNTGTNLTVTGNNTIILSSNIGNTTQAGIVQLNDTFTSISTTQATTANVANTIWTTGVAAFNLVNSTTNLVTGAYALANSDANLVGGAYLAANNALNLSTSAYGRANASVQNQHTFTATNGLAANGGSTATVTGNNTVALTANNASITQIGVVQLNDTFTSTSTTQAATANVANTIWTNHQAAFSAINSTTNLVTSAFNLANSDANLVAGAYIGANSAGNLATSAYGRANAVIQNQQTFISSNGITTNSATTLTISGNTTILLSANISNTTQAGIVQLNDTINSGSISQAATANAVSTVFITAQAAFNKANAGGGGGAAINQTILTANGLTVNTGVNLSVFGNNTIILSANLGNTTQVGVVQLNDTVTSTSTTLATTANIANTIWATSNGAFIQANNALTLATSDANLITGAYALANSTTNLVASAFSQANTTATGLTSTTNLVTSAFNLANSDANLVSGAYAGANSAGNLATSSYGRANAAIQNQITFTATNGLTANGGSTATVTGNNTVALSANAATTTTIGVVQLNDTFTSTSTTQASTANVANTIWTNHQAAFTAVNSATNLVTGAYALANSDANLVGSAFSLANTTATGLTSTTNLVGSAFTLANSTATSLVSTTNLVTSAYGRANAAIQNQHTFTATNGLAANGGSTATITGNNTVALTANNASTTVPGVVQLNDTFISTSTTQAVTANVANTIWTTTVAAFSQANTSATGLTSVTNLVASAFNLANSDANLVGSAFSLANTNATGLTSTTNLVAAAFTQANTTATGLTSTTNLVASAFALANSDANLVSGAYAGANSAGNLATSAYGRANAAIQNQITLTATGGISVNTGSTATVTGNNTIAITANSASTTQVGVVQLNDTFTSILTTQAATTNVANTIWTTTVAAFSQANTTATGLTSTTNLVGSAFSLANTNATGLTSTTNLVTSSYLLTNSTTNLVASAYARANASLGFEVQNFTATNGLAVNAGSFISTQGNNTVAFTANNASTTVPGIVQLNDTFTSVLTTQAATSNVANTIYNIAKAAFNQANVGSGVVNDTFTSTSTTAAASANVANTIWTTTQAAFTKANLNYSFGNAIIAANLTVTGGTSLVINSNTILIVSANLGNTTQFGVVQTNDTVTSTSTSLVATANAINTVWTTVTAAYSSGNTNVNRAGDAMTGTLTVNNLTSNVGINTATIISNTFIAGSVTLGIGGVGVTQGTAQKINSQINIVTVSGAGANSGILPTPPIGTEITIVNQGVSGFNVWPPVSHGIDTLALNANTNVRPSGFRKFVYANSIHWYTTANGVYTTP